MLKKVTLRQKLLIILIIFSALPTFVLSGSLYSKLYDIRDNEKQNVIYDNISNNTDSLNNWINTKINLIESVEFLISTLNKDSDLDIENLILKVNESSLNIEEVYAFRPQEKVLLEEDANLEWYLGAYRNDKLIISEIHKDRFDNDVISFAYDMKFRNENYVVAIDLSLEELKKEIAKIYYRNGHASGIFVDGHVIYIDDSIKNIELDKIIFNDTSGVLLSNDGINSIGISKEIDNNLELIIVENFTDNISIINSLRLKFIKLMLGVLFISFLLAVYLSMRLISPIENLKKGLKNTLRGNSDVTISEGDYEYLELYELYRDMKSKNRSYDYRKIEIEQSSDQVNREYEITVNQLEKTIDEIKNIENEIKNSNRKYDNLFNNIKDFIWTIDIDGRIFSVNNIFLEKLGYKENEAVGVKLKDIIIQNDELVNIDDFMFEVLRKDLSSKSIYLKKKTYSEYELVVFNSKRIIDNGKLLGTQFVARTIVDKEILERKMYKRNKELEFIKEISKTLTNSKNLEELLTSIAQKIKNLVESGVCSIWLLGDNGKLEMKASSDENIDFKQKDSVDMDENILAEAIVNNKIIRVDSFNEISEKKYGNIVDDFDDLEEIIFIPLENNGKPSGVISIGLGAKLSELDLDILSAFASQSSVAIEKAKLYEKLKLEYFNTIKVLATAVEAKDTYTEGHSIRVSKFASLIGEKLEMNELELEELEISGILHDIGKIGVDDTILTKPGQLSDDEYMEIRKHPEVGARIIKPIELSESIVEGVLYHHITFEGKGYPDKRNHEIKSKTPYIIGVADALDAMTSNRLYSEKKSIGDAIEELLKFSGTQFSPEIVNIVNDIYQANPEKLNEISEFKTVNKSEKLL